MMRNLTATKWQLRNIATIASYVTSRAMNECYVVLAFALAAVIMVSLWFGLNDVQVAAHGTHAGTVASHL